MIQIFTLEDAEKWDSAVRFFRDYDVYYLSGYVRAFQLHGDGEPLLICGEAGGARGINVVMKRDIAADPHFAGKIPEHTYFDFATPYGYGGWLTEGADTAGLFAEYEAWCCKNNIVSEFVRYHPVLKNHEYAVDAYQVIPLGNTVAMDLTTPEAIWENISSKNRNMIRKAQKNGIKVYAGRCPELFQTFKRIYDRTMDKDQAADYYYFQEPFYASILEDLPHNSQIFYAVAPSGEIIAASIMLWANGRMNYHLSGSVREYQHLAPSNLLLYEAAMWGCQNGCKTLHLGGGVGSGEDGLFKFKRSFYRGELYRYHIGKKIFSQERYSELLALRAPQPEGGFFPAYRA